MNILKNIFTVAVAAGMGLASVSCSDYLDTQKYFKDEQSLEKIFNDKEFTMQFLTFAYSRLQGDNIEIGHSELCPTNFCDDMTFNENGNGDRYRKFKLGEIGYGYAYQDYYKNCWDWSYTGIRQASIFINNVHPTELLSEEEATDLKGQARFLRAYFYWMLFRKYGPVPLLPLDGADYTKSYDELSYPRVSTDTLVNFVASEMAQAARELPDRRDNLNIARPTKRAALAVRAKILTYAASPLYNGNTEFADFTDKQGHQLIPQTYDNRKWAVAAAACRDLIEYADRTGLVGLHTVSIKTTGGDESYPQTVVPPYNAKYSDKPFPNGWADIDPFESYRSEFNGELYAAENKELLFTRGKNMEGKDLKTEYGVPNLVRHQLPVSLGGWNTHGMTWKQMTAYEMADGSSFDYTKVKEQYGADNVYTTKNNAKLHPYDHLPNNGVWMGFANREPRFYASCAYSGFVWPNSSCTEKAYRNLQVFYYRGTDNGRSNGSERWVNTGIGVAKYVHPSDGNRGTNSAILPKVEPTLRYADILLLYAEALNNVEGSYDIPSYDGTTTYTITRDVEQMRRGVKPVRMRAGVPDYDDDVYADKDKFFQAIVHERQIELFGENNRYYDVRRWKIAPEVESAQIYGCNTLMTAQQRDLFYRPVRVPKLQTSFSRRQYFWPISYEELKRNKNMTQAPGWLDYD